MQKTTIIYDWNGTLLNDVQMCVDCMNVLLKKRGLPALTREKYRNVFDFPVKDYYRKIGFDYSRESFEVPAKEFMDLYHRFLPETALFSCAEDVLTFFREKGFHQYIISAMEHNSLLKTLEEKGILFYFDGVSGIDNIYAGGKAETARVFLNNSGLTPQEIVFVGDTLHDLDVAGSLGLDCILVAAGHQSKERLLARTSRVVDTLTEIKQEICPD